MAMATPIWYDLKRSFLLFADQHEQAVQAKWVDSIFFLL